MTTVRVGGRRRGVHQVGAYTTICFTYRRQRFALARTAFGVAAVLSCSGTATSPKVRPPQIAFSSNGTSIFVMNADGSGLVELIGSGVEVAWAPDGAKLAFRSDRDGNDEIYV